MLRPTYLVSGGYEAATTRLAVDKGASHSWNHTRKFTNVSFMDDTICSSFQDGLRIKSRIILRMQYLIYRNTGDTIMGLAWTQVTYGS